MNQADILGSPYPYLVHKTIGAQRSLALLKDTDEYLLVTSKNWVKPTRCTKDNLIRLAYDWTRPHWAYSPEYVEMGKFIREYVGEARWILVTLENM